MNLLFVSNVYPPEVAPLANRLSEHARTWVADGGSIDVITDPPNYPEGEVYPGYRNRFFQETMEGVRVTRVPMYIAENRGTIRRTLSYISFMLSVIWYSRRLRNRPDVVAASSPQFFSALAGYVLSRRLKVPFVLEIRDLWPESIVAVGAAKRGALIKLFERLELFLYRKSDHIVVVTNSFREYIVTKGIDAGKITVIKNGADLEAATKPIDEEALCRVRDRFDLSEKYVVSYIGTIGMAHRADIMLEAAALCNDPDVLFVVVGSGAERDSLVERATKSSLRNFRLIDKQPRETVRELLAISGASVVHLRRSDVFKTVLPSKMFEAMAMRTPIVLGVEGESAEVVMEAGAGIVVKPEDAQELVAAVLTLKRDPSYAMKCGNNGFAYLLEHHDRRELARRFWRILEHVVAGKRPPMIAPDDRRRVLEKAS